MANNFGATTWNIDTVFAAPIAKNHITNCEIYVRYITWTDQVAAGDQVIIQDRNGTVIMDAKTNAANNPIILSNPGWIEGIQIPTLVSGKINIGIGK